MRLFLLAVLGMFILSAGHCAAEVPAYLVDTLSNSEGISNLIVCATFDDAFEKYDKPALKNFLSSFPCRENFFQIIFVPHSDDVYDKCKRYAREFDARIFRLARADREALGLNYAPSMAVVRADGTLAYSTVNFDHDLHDALVPTGEVRLVCREPQLKKKNFWMRSNQCPTIKHSFTGVDTSLFVPVGQYAYHVGKTKGVLTVDPSGAATVTVPSDQYPTQKPLSRYRSWGPLYIGLIHWGAQTFRFREGNHTVQELYPTMGVGVRYLGFLGAEGRVLLSINTEEDEWFDIVKVEGYAIGGELAPAFLSRKDFFAVSFKAGYYLIDPNMRGPAAMRNVVEYREPYVGGAIYLGRLGRIRNSPKWRLGGALEVLYSSPQTYSDLFDPSSGAIAPAISMGGVSFAASVQFEF